MKRPKQGKGWKPYRVYIGSSRFDDFMTKEEAEKYINGISKSQYLRPPLLIEVDPKTGEEIKS